MAGAAQDPRVDKVRALRDAGITALLAFGLFLPLIGFQTVTNVRNDLILTTRWPLLFAIVAFVGFGRLAYSLVVFPRLHASAPKSESARPAWRVTVWTMVHPVCDRVRRCVSRNRHCHCRLRSRGKVDRQFRHPDPDLRDARLGP